ncbi:tyrosine-type recombinase/integrase [Chloroflexota bacterium]
MPNKPKGLSSREDVLSTQEFNMLLSVCVSLRDKLVVYSLLFAGLRVSELKHLRRSWVNFQEGTITIPTRQYCQCSECKKKRDGIWKPKTKRGARTILIHPALTTVLSEFLAVNEELGLTRQRVWQRVKELAHQARIIRGIYPHCCRATAATILAHKGISAASLQYDFGWERLSSAESYVKSDMKRAHMETKEIYAREVQK